MTKRAEVPPSAKVLSDRGVAFALHQPRLGGASADDPRDVSAALGADPSRLLSVVVALVDEQPTIVLVPVLAEVDLVALASAVGGKHAVGCDATTTERLLKRDAIEVTPIAPHQHLPTVIDSAILDSETVFLPAGRRGTFVELRPSDLVEATGGRTAPITAT